MEILFGILGFVLTLTWVITGLITVCNTFSRKFKLNYWKAALFCLCCGPGGWVALIAITIKNFFSLLSFITEYDWTKLVSEDGRSYNRHYW